MWPAASLEMIFRRADEVTDYRERLGERLVSMVLPLPPPSYGESSDTPSGTSTPKPGTTGTCSSSASRQSPSMTTPAPIVSGRNTSDQTCSRASQRRCTESTETR